MSAPRAAIPKKLNYVSKRRASFGVINDRTYAKVYNSTDEQKDFDANGVNGEVATLRNEETQQEIIVKRMLVSKLSVPQVLKEAELTAVVLGWSAHTLDERNTANPTYYYLAMPKIPGITIREYPFKTASHFLQIASLALTGLQQELHDKKIVHFDLNAGNLIVSPNGDKVTYIDFDLSNYVGENLKPMAKDHLYAAPESREKSAVAKFSNDVYSILRLFVRIREKPQNNFSWYPSVEKRFSDIYQQTQQEDPAKRPAVVDLARELGYLSVISYFIENQDKLLLENVDADKTWHQCLPAAIRDFKELTDVLADVDPKNKLAFLNCIGISQLRKLIKDDNALGEVLEHLSHDEKEKFLFDYMQEIRFIKIKICKPVSVVPSSLFVPSKDFCILERVNNTKTYNIRLSLYEKQFISGQKPPQMFLQINPLA